MIKMQQFNANGALVGLEKALWETLRQKLTPLAWAWYDAHKDQQVTKIFGVYTVRVGSFGIAEAIITNLLGPRPVT